MLYLNQNLLTELVEIVEIHSEECCGFFLGEEVDEHRIVTAILHVPNTSPGDRQRSFKIAPRDYIETENFADHHNLKVLGIYHSHPNCPAVPSEYDRMAAQPYFSYIILSVMDKKFEAIRSWNLNSNFQFDEESLAIVNINPLQLHGYRNYSNTAA